MKIVQALLVYNFLSLLLYSTSLNATIKRRQILVPPKLDAGKQIKIAFLDADSTIRISKSGAVTASGPDDVVLIPGVAEKIKELNEAGYFVVIISNQGGVPRYLSLEQADAGLQKMIELLAEAGAIINYYDFAENNDHFRKPNTGTVEELEKTLQILYGRSIDREQSFMVGDAAYSKAKNGRPAERMADGTEGQDDVSTDRLFAENAHIRFYDPSDFLAWKAQGILRIRSLKDAEKLAQALSSCRKLLLE